MIEIDTESFLAVVVVGRARRLPGGRRVDPPAAAGRGGRDRARDHASARRCSGLAEPDEFLDFFSNLGLGMLFFFAGYEIDFERIRGSPLRLAVLGWFLSLVLAYALGGLLAAGRGGAVAAVHGSAMATTAIGTLIPILSDAGELRTRFGTYLLAAGAIGEFGPIL